MSTLRDRIIAALAGSGLAPLHRFGQNFMVDAGALEALCDEAGVAPGTHVVEIGPGTGVLTERLLDRGASVLAIEIDRGLAAHIERSLVPRGLRLVHADALAGKNELHPAIVTFAAEPWRLCANLPYDIAIPALLCAAALQAPAQQPDVMCATVQYEAAERLCSAPGSDAWGATAAVLQAAGTPRIVRKLSPSSFHPRPRVDSAILVWRPRGRLPVGFDRWCRRVFSARRKVVTRALRDTGLDRDLAEASCRACAIASDRRLETLTVDELLRLHAAAGAPGGSP
jgi:16S rRNA (adenine1518-N6/adenine1519-N6)-dimethyltransferase